MIGLELLIEQCAPEIAPSTMQAIIKVESGGDPWAIGNNTLHKKVTPSPKTKDEAIATAKYYIAMGHSLDLGLAQINSANLGKLGLSVDEVFDPCTNLKASSNILKGFYAQAKTKYGDGRKALAHALSGYNTGSLYRGQTYVDRIVNAAGVAAYEMPRVSTASSAVNQAPKKGKSKPTVSNAVFYQNYIDSKYKNQNYKVLVDDDGYGILIK